MNWKKPASQPRQSICMPLQALFPRFWLYQKDVAENPQHQLDQADKGDNSYLLGAGESAGRCNVCAGATPCRRGSARGWRRHAQGGGRKSRGRRRNKSIFRAEAAAWWWRWRALTSRCGGYAKSRRGNARGKRGRTGLAAGRALTIGRCRI